MSDLKFTYFGDLNAPFTYFGGKSTIAGEVWRRFGNVDRYIEPFFGSGAVLFGRPYLLAGMVEIVNDLDGMICNFWRAVREAPQEVSRYAQWPVVETDLHARRQWLIDRIPQLEELLAEDPHAYDAQAAGYWVWGMSLWTGSGFTAKKCRWQQKPRIYHDKKNEMQNTQLETLAARLENVAVFCGDWFRCCTDAMVKKSRSGRENIVSGIFLDPPYAKGRTENLYVEDSLHVAQSVGEWALEHGNDPNLRIALCGYIGEDEMPGWHKYHWVARGGFAARGSRAAENRRKEVVWFSPHCGGGQHALSFE